MFPNHLSVTWVRHQFSLVLEIDNPVVNSVEAMAKFLAERKIQIESVTVGSDNGLVLMVIYCYLEKDRLKHIMHLLGTVAGVIKLDLLETK